MAPPHSMLSRRSVIAGGLGSGLMLVHPSLLRAAERADLSAVQPQPYFASVSRAAAAMARLGSPLSATDAREIAALARRGDHASVAAAEAILSRYTLAQATILPDGPPQLAAGGAPKSLVEQAWRMFLVRLANPAGRTDAVFLYPSAYGSLAGDMFPGDFHVAQRAFLMDTLNKGPMIASMWLATQLDSPVTRNVFGREVPIVTLSGIPVEYHVVQLYSRDAGKRTASLTLYSLAGIPTDPTEQPSGGRGKSRPAITRATLPGNRLGPSGHAVVDFDCLRSRVVTLGVRDVDGRGCVAGLTIRDKLGRVYPPMAMRIAPDLAFQPQVYRGDGETMRLADGDYTVEAKRGPEYLPMLSDVTISPAKTSIDVTLQRWIDPARWGWYSGDTHIHGGGCAHYQVPTEGVAPETMIRHIRGEGLAMAEVLSWGPSWYYQKQFFSGRTISPAAGLEHPELQAANNTSLVPHVTAEDLDSTMRYDVEVSGFPSSHAGHLVLLDLKQQDYPGTRLIEDWPSWNLPILTWARGQGALVGYAHCGNGMIVESEELPNYLIPPMDGNGTQEGIVDAAHGVVDFLSGGNTAPLAELNAWYHMLNCGIRMAMIGETDFPCITGDRVGGGRSYVRLDKRPAGEAGYDAWLKGLAAGKLYYGDGRSHFLDFKVGGQRTGEGDLALAAPGPVKVEALVAAWLDPDSDNDPPRIVAGWGWNLAWARIGRSREVPVELVVNGVAVDKTTLVADGTPRSISFDANIARSSWVALRIMPSGHTHPLYVPVAGKPIRASKRSADWCRDCVDKVWQVKSPFMRESELPAAKQAFDVSRKFYERISAECEVA